MEMYTTFEDYGMLKFLETEEFYADGWSHYDIATDSDGEKYDIMINSAHTEFRCCIV